MKLLLDLKHGILPGYHFSTISNICQKLDERLNGLAKKTGATHSHTPDDITFRAMECF
jgi:hypothetical protein